MEVEEEEEEQEEKEEEEEERLGNKGNETDGAVQTINLNHHFILKCWGIILNHAILIFDN